MKALKHLILIVLVGLLACSRTDDSLKEVNPEFSRYVSGFTKGDFLSVGSHFIVRLQNQVTDTALLRNIPAGLFEFSPAIEGQTRWLDAQTIEFIPEQKLKSNTIYNITFFLGKIVKVPAKFEKMEFEIKTIKQAITLEDGNLLTYENEMRYFKYSGQIYTADLVDNDKMEKCLNATYAGKNLKIKWEHGVEGKSHQFSIDSIARKKSGQEMVFTLDGSEIEAESKEEISIRIPGVNEFEVLNVDVQSGNNQSITIYFSDPLSKNQNIDGLVYLEDGTSLNLEKSRNFITATPSIKLSGTVKLTVSKSIKNALSYKLKNDYFYDIKFESMKPAVRFLGSGVILPQKDGMVLPFEAVNLSMVDVSIIQIYEDNVLSFLQTNNLDGNNQISRAGRLIVRKRIDLRKSGQNPERWNTYKIDLTQFFQPQTGAIYKVEIEFRKEYSTYNCESNNTTEQISDEEYALETKTKMKSYDKTSYYDWEYDYEYDYYPDDYDWEQRENPCNASYYTPDKTITKNILVSDIGIVAKGTQTNQYLVAVSNILSANAISGATITFYNLQKQEIGKGKTDENGFYKSELKQKPHFIVAEYQSQKGYLKVSDNDMLPFSNFDVGGVVQQEGMKGFIYGERGVWRPGDDIYITFILEDKYDQLPDNYPVKFSLYNPSNQLIETRTVKYGPDGFYVYKTKTSTEAQTGNWFLKVQAGSATFSRNLKIETIKPNRLRSKIEFGKDVITVSDLEKPIMLTSQWLHGMPAANLNYKIQQKVRKAKTTFNKYGQYQFDNIATEMSYEEIDLAEGYLNDEGEAEIDMNQDFAGAAGFLDVTYTTRIFEKSGDFSITTQSVKISPYEVYVGAKMLTAGEHGWYDIKQKHQLGVVAVTDKGKPIANRQVKVAIYKVNWRWWWQSYENLSYYVNQSSQSLVEEFSLKTNSAGLATGTFKLKHQNYHDNGRYLILVSDLNGNHISSFTAYFSEWYGSIGGVGEAATILALNSDKGSYKVGETAKISFPSSEGAEAIVSIEKGSEIVDAFRVKTTAKQTMVNIPINAGMAPSVYINITLLQPHSQTVNDHPIRMYGIVPLEIEDPNTKVQPVITMKDFLEPEKKFTVNVKESTGKPMTYTLAIVDEGLLDITAFSTPDPWKHFYSREALQVRTWDLYDYVIGAYGARLEKAIAIGGGDKIMDPSKTKSQRFKPVVFFSGPHTLEAGKSINHNFTMPNYVGSVRVMVIAGKDASYGKAEKAVPVKKDLMLLTTMPRVLGPGEMINIPVTVFAMDKKVTKVQLNLTVNKMFKPLGSLKQTISFSKPGEKIVYFPVEVNLLTGGGIVRIDAVSGNVNATDQIEIEIRNPNLPQTVVYDTLIPPGKSWTKSVKAFGVKGTNSASVEISTMLPVNLKSRIDYLIHYPYGCIEQTVSAVFPQLFLENLVLLKEEQKTEIQHNIDAALIRLRQFQLPNGAFSYWPGQEYLNVWGTNYAGHFLIEAKSKGYKIPEGMLTSWLRYQSTAANQWTKYDRQGGDLEQAYRLFLLAKAQKPESSAMNRMRESEAISSRARILLAGAYALMNQKTAAVKVLANAKTSTKENYDNYFDYTFGCKTRDNALFVLVLNALNKKTEAFTLVKEIAEELSSEQWMSTQTTSMSLLALSEFMETTKPGNLSGNLVVDGKSLAVKTDKILYSNNLMIDDLKSHKVKITNNSTGNFYVKIISTGTPAVSNEMAESKNLSLDIEYLDMDGNKIDPSKIVQGTDFKAHITVSNTGYFGDYYNLALTHIFPSGWEIINKRLLGTEDNIGFKPDYQDIRDDRVSNFFYLSSRKSVSFDILLTAAYEGKYYLPAVHCSAMYENRVKAVVPGQWVEVIRK